jgi:DNA-binding MarR family transcriptional regulator
LTKAGYAFSELLIEIFRANGAALAAGDVLTAPVGLTSSRWQVMGAIGETPATVSHVARAMGLTRQSVQQVADALERDDFVVYRDNPHHKRAKLIALTNSGAKALAEVEARHVLWANRLAKKLGASPAKAIALLKETRALLEAELEE